MSKSGNSFLCVTRRQIFCEKMWKTCILSPKFGMENNYKRDVFDISGDGRMIHECGWGYPNAICGKTATLFYMLGPDGFSPKCVGMCRCKEYKIRNHHSHWIEIGENNFSVMEIMEEIELY